MTEPTDPRSTMPATQPQPHSFGSNSSAFRGDALA